MTIFVGDYGLEHATALQKIFHDSLSGATLLFCSITAEFYTVTLHPFPCKVDPPFDFVSSFPRPFLKSWEDDERKGDGTITLEMDETGAVMRRLHRTTRPGIKRTFRLRKKAGFGQQTHLKFAKLKSDEQSSIN